MKSMSATGAVAGWAVALFVLTGILAAYGGGQFVLLLFGGSALLIVVTAVFVALSGHRRPGAPRTVSLPGSATPALLAALAAVCIGNGIVFGAWLMLLAPVPLTAAVSMVVTDHRRRRAVR